MKPKGAHLGQHFLTGSGIVSKIVAASEIRSDDTVVEIGPGKGVLTRELLARGATVIAIEKDSSLVAHLRETLANEIAGGKLILVEDDIRNFDLASISRRSAGSDVVRERNKSQASRTEAYGERRGDVSDKEIHTPSGSYKLVANIPYYITGEILRMFLSTPQQPTAMTLLIQKEVAERIVAKDGKESILSLSVKAYGDPHIVSRVPRGAFSPAPSVDSAILLIDSISRERFASRTDEERFFKVVKAGFAAKRKMLAGNLRAIAEDAAIAEAFDVCSIDASVRAEDVPLQKWLLLAERLT